VSPRRRALDSGDLTRARSTLEENVRQHANDRDALEALCRFLFENGPLAEAEQRLEELVRCFPDDGAANYNLGMARMRQGKARAAVTAFQESLRQRSVCLSRGSIERGCV
jgi:predicted Zn-dependent protease